jgi:SPP1 family predicted phage head-tail adaptor
VIQPGRLDEIVEIQELTTSTDGMGGTTESWAATEDSPKRAERMPLRGQEMLEVGTLRAKTPVKWRIRRWSSLTSKHRIKHDSRYYKILAIEDYYRQGRDMVVWTEEIE